MNTKLSFRLRQALASAVRKTGGRCTKARNLVLFGSSSGRFYCDNSYHLFEWVLRERRDINAVWMTRERQIFRRLRSMERPVAMVTSFRGLVALSRARVAVFTNRLTDIAYDSFAVPHTIKLIALRHGRSVKCVRFARKTHKITSSEAHERLHEGKMIRYAISTSSFVSNIQEECLKIGREKHIVTGYPRNDYLLNVSLWDNEIKDSMHKGSKISRRIILYAPTWRHGRNPTLFFPFKDFDVRTLIRFLEENNLRMLLRPHKNDLEYTSVASSLDYLSRQSDAILKATHNDYPDANRLLPYVDVLITDYSAIYHDYLLMNRPIIFVPYDYKEFGTQNGFLYDYFSLLPGPAVYTFQAFLRNLKRSLQCPDYYMKKRIALRDKIHHFQDSNSCYRVMELIDDLLTE